MSRPVPPRWDVVVPVKGTVEAKSRLAAQLRAAPGGTLGPGGRGQELAQELARALALDTLTAAGATPGVRLVVVSPYAQLPAGLHTLLPPLLVPEPVGGLGAAVAAGLAATRTAPEGASGSMESASGVAVLLGDLPALRPADLTAALAACRQALTPAAAASRASADAVFVPDAEGTGTVLLAARHGDALHPAFGAGSAARHARHARRLDLDLPRLRRDVDTLADLTQARALGLGPHTAALDCPALAS